jgi:C_GCAxxG_C_C family probable redox protein
MNRIEQTVDLHRNQGLNCAQALLTAFGQNLDIDPNTAKMLGRSLAGGIGLRADTCGYLTAACLILAKANDQADEAQARKDTFAAVKELFKKFEEKRGATACRDLLGADMSTEDGNKKIDDQGLVAKTCKSDNGIGHDVAEILVGIIG